MKVVNIAYNKDAEELLEITLDKVRDGEIRSIALSWVTSTGAIGGDISKGKDNFAQWASIQHLERTFYKNVIDNEEKQ